jgi:enamine deaminase RidA (YjgF/YER057c/UK114 family)
LSASATASNVQAKVFLPSSYYITNIPGGWHPTTFAISTDIKTQIAQAFETIDVMLRDAGGKGWEQVFRVNSYHVPLNGEALTIMGEQFQKWMPNHKPVWTAVGVQRLGLDDMRVEIEVSAYDPQTQK